MKIGYARVSTDDQSFALQMDALTQSGCERIYCDKISGSTTSRPEFDKMMDALRPGDILTVWKLDRIGRSLRHLIEVVEGLHQQSIELHLITEGIDTSTPAGRMAYQMMGAVAEYERNIIKERVNAGLASAKARGRVGGRKPALTVEKRKQAVALFNSKTMSVAGIAKMFGISRPTLYKYAKEKNKVKPQLKTVG